MTRAHQRLARRGFTLVELLVVLAIAGLILAVTPPLLGNAMPGLQHKAAARRTANALRVTREVAIARGRPADWSIDSETGTYHIAPGGRGGALPGGIGIACETAQALAEPPTCMIRFFPDGTSTGGLVLLTRGERRFTVGVNWLTGRVLIRDEVAQ